MKRWIVLVVVALFLLGGCNATFVRVSITGDSNTVTTSTSDGGTDVAGNPAATFGQ